MGLYYDIFLSSMVHLSAGMKGSQGGAPPEVQWVIQVMSYSSKSEYSTVIQQQKEGKTQNATNKHYPETNSKSKAKS